MNLTFGIELEFTEVRSIFLRKKLPAGWECRGDNSLRNMDSSWSDHNNPMSKGSEVKTIGGRPLDDLIAEIPGIYETVLATGGDVNKTCGLHIHVGFGDWSAKDILTLARYFAASPSFAKAVGCSAKRAGDQCMRVTPAVVKTISDNIGDLDALKRMSTRVPRAHVPIRQLEVNVLSLLHHGTVEFRAFNQTLDPSLAINCLRYADEVMRAALSGDPFPTPSYPLPVAL